MLLDAADNEDVEVFITDGWNVTSYHLDNAEIQMSEDISGVRFLDIGVGGCEIE